MTPLWKIQFICWHSRIKWALMLLLSALKRCGHLCRSLHGGRHGWVPGHLGLPGKHNWAAVHASGREALRSHSAHHVTRSVTAERGDVTDTDSHHSDQYFSAIFFSKVNSFLPSLVIFMKYVLCVTQTDTQSRLYPIIFLNSVLCHTAGSHLTL